MASHEYQQQLEELANKLVTPERYGQVAVLPNLDYTTITQLFPETARVYEFPTPENNVV